MIKYLFLAAISLSLTGCYEKFGYKTLEQNEKNYQSEQYVLGSGDIPLFSSLKQLDEESAGFDTVAGSIVISSYIGDVKSSEVKYFYIDALPQLGWQLIDETEDNISYKRSNDILEISLKQRDDKLLVKFFISSST